MFRLFVLASLLGVVASAHAQEARLQIVHNAPDPALASVDVYVNGVLVPELDDFRFREATAYFPIEANTVATVAVAPDTSSSVLSAYFVEALLVQEEGEYTAFIQGLLDPEAFPPNPDGRDTALALRIFSWEGSSGIYFDIGTDDEHIRMVIHEGAPLLPTHAFGVYTAQGSGYFAFLGYGGGTGRFHFPVGDFNYRADYPGYGRVILSDSDVPTVDGSIVAFATSGLGGAVRDGHAHLAVLAIEDNGTVQVFDVYELTAAESAPPAPPDAFTLRGNYPNPFNPSTTISFDLASPAGVSVEVFDVLGRNILTTATASFSAGAGHEIQLDASSLPSGTYLYRVLAEMSGGVQIQTRRMTLLK